MNYLLDTHVFLWMLAAPDLLSAKARAVIQNPDRSIYVSAVTAVEIAIKTGIGKLEAPGNLREEIQSRGLRELPFALQPRGEVADAFSSPCRPL